MASRQRIEDDVRLDVKAVLVAAGSEFNRVRLFSPPSALAACHCLSRLAVGSLTEGAVR